MQIGLRFRRAGGAALALLLGLVVCEVGLQVATRVNRTLRRRDAGVELSPADRVWVCIGDSNTYGVFEDVEDTYPAVLGRLLTEHAPAESVRVVNLGLPATNAPQALAVLEDALEEYRPELALVLTGANNAWSWRASDDVEWSGPPWYEHLRLVRLGRLLRQSLTRRGPGGLRPALAADGRGQVQGLGRDGRRLSFELDDRETTRDAAELRASIERDLARLVERLESETCRAVFLTYGWDEGTLGTANQAIRKAAGALGIPLIDCAPSLAAASHDVPEELLFYSDRHLRGLGYEHFARAVLEGLHDAGLVRLDGPLPAALAPSVWAPAPTLTWPAGEALPLVHIASGDPHRPFAVVLSSDTGESFAHLGGRRLPVYDDGDYRANLLAPALLGTTDGEGRATVDLAPLARSVEDLRGRSFLAAYVLYQGIERPKVRSVSRAVRFRVP